MILYVVHKALCQSNVEAGFFVINGTNKWAHKQAAMSSNNFGSYNTDNLIIGRIQPFNSSVVFFDQNKWFNIDFHRLYKH